MIKTTYMRIAAAAELLGTDVDTLLIAAAERRVAAYWLMNEWMGAELVRYEVFDHHDSNPIGQWEKLESVLSKHFLFVPLHFAEAAEFLRCETTIPSAHFLSDENKDGWRWQPIGGFDGDRRKAIGRDCVYLKRADVEQIQTHGWAEKQTTRLSDEYLNPQMRQGLSEDLMRMIQAARRFWGNAKHGEPDTQHTNDEVAAWLEQQGMTKTRTKRAASLIRPSWAHNGRKPES